MRGGNDDSESDVQSQDETSCCMGRKGIREEYTGRIFTDSFEGTKDELRFYRVLDVNGRKMFFESERSYLAYRLAKAREYANSTDPAVLQKVSPYSYEPLPLWKLGGYVPAEEEEDNDGDDHDDEARSDHSRGGIVVQK